jgi:hypothetical protein
MALLASVSTEAQPTVITRGGSRAIRPAPAEKFHRGRSRRNVVRGARALPAGEKHWHGASPQASMTHIAITEHGDGTAVQWMEKVSDEQTTARRRFRKCPNKRKRSLRSRRNSSLNLSLSARARADRPGRCSQGSLAASRPSPMMCSSVMCGDGPSCPHATAVW